VRSKHGLRRYDGEGRWFLFRIEPVRDNRGCILKWYGANTDIDDRKRAQALLAAEKRTLEMIASGAAADSRTAAAGSAMGPEVRDLQCRLFGFDGVLTLLFTHRTLQPIASRPNMDMSRSRLPRKCRRKGVIGNLSCTQIPAQPNALRSARIDGNIDAPAMIEP
jgi:hypothetical protein